MNFYRAQQDAKRKTLQLALLFGAAVLTLLFLTNALVATAYVWMSDANRAVTAPWQETLRAIPLEIWLAVSAGVVAVVGLACLYKYLIVRGGGKAIAESVGGKRINQSTLNRKEKRLLNVVEEMALAAGIPVPPVYLIPEPSINAFAAGFGTDDAVVGINQGTLDLLNREELQGVVAHEFSHIMNGDTRINLRLIAILHGILFIGIIGYMLLRTGGRSRGGRNGNSGMPILLLGIGFMAIGYGGTFFGNLIKSAVSRQREYLADGSAVQYTRNPQGIGGALKKIGGLSVGSSMTHPNAKEASHMFFGQVLRSRFGGLMSTHPPLPDRILALEPRWNGNFPDLSAQNMAIETGDRSALDALDTSGASGFAGASGATDIDPDDHDDFDVLEQKVAVVNEVIGNPDASSHQNALAVLQSTDPLVREAAHNPWAAKATAYALLLSGDPKENAEQLIWLQGQEQHGVPGRARELALAIAELDDLHRLTLLQTCMPALKEMSLPQYKHFMTTVNALIKQDQKIELFEWVLHRILTKELSPHFQRPRPVRWRFNDTDKLQAEATILLSALAAQGSNDPQQRQRAFTAGLAELDFQAPLDESADPNFTKLNGALSKLRQLAPLAKPKLIKACATTVLADAHVTVNEGALLQGVAATLDCPLPPAIYKHIG